MIPLTVSPFGLVERGCKGRAARDKGVLGRSPQRAKASGMLCHVVASERRERGTPRSVGRPQNAAITEWKDRLGLI